MSEPVKFATVEDIFNGRLRGNQLMASGIHLGPEEARLLWNSPKMAQVNWLDLDDNRLGDEGVKDLAECGYLTNIQYFVYYKLDATTSIGAAPNIIANWEQDSDDAFTVPVGIGISKTFRFGKVPVRFGLEYHYSVVQPDSTVGTDWNVRFYVIPAVPSALFSWMQ